MAKLDPIVSEFATTEDAEAYDAWFRAKVQASLDDPGPGIPHDEVMARVQKIIDKARSSHESDRKQFSSYPTFNDYGFNGLSALEALMKRSVYGSLPQALASLTVFSHPETVRQTGCQALFKIVRAGRLQKKYTFGEIHGVRVMFDDNLHAANAFFWGNNLKDKRAHRQVNHVYSVQQDIKSYTSLANLCLTPAFMAKLTDKGMEEFLQYRCYDLYQWFPQGRKAPRKPPGYDDLVWADPLPPVEDVKKTIERQMKTKPLNETVKACSALGWLFGAAVGDPDAS